MQKWATTISLLTSAVIKLSEHSPMSRQLYRSWPCYFACPPWPGGRPPIADALSATVVEKGFASASTSAEYTAAYNGNKWREGTLVVIEPSFGTRGADIGCLSQYPEQEETTFPPCTSFSVIAHHRMATLPKNLILVRPHLCAMRHYTEGLRYPWSVAD